MAGERERWGRGPFQADQLRSGDPYELSNGHAILCQPTGARGGKANLLGGAVLASDPAVAEAGVDVGFSPEPGTMRAPDVSIGNISDEPGWAKGVPALALEYADRGQDEKELVEKIAELLAHGTKFVWVVRLSGIPHVEVHQPKMTPRIVDLDGVLEAPGVLARPVSVRSLLERDAGLAATLDNLLVRHGYAEGLVGVREEGREEGRAAVFRELFVARFGPLDESAEARLREARAEDLRTWTLALLAAKSPDDVFRP
jgi:Uma2 family endonuclease